VDSDSPLQWRLQLNLPHSLRPLNLQQLQNPRYSVPPQSIRKCLAPHSQKLAPLIRLSLPRELMQTPVQRLNRWAAQQTQSGHRMHQPPTRLLRNRL
jgi:hypothetical protein